MQSLAESHDGKFLKKESQIFKDTYREILFRMNKLNSATGINLSQINSEAQKIIENSFSESSLDKIITLIDTLAVSCLQRGKFFVRKIKDPPEKVNKNAILILDEVVIEFDLNELTDPDFLLFFAVLNKINQFSSYRNFYNREFNIARLNELQTALHNFKHGLVLLSENGEVIFHNKKFSEISFPLPKLLKLKNGETNNFSGNTYKVIKYSFQHSFKNYEIMILVLGESVYKKNGPPLNSVDLGIISSSIAHELNNPLAGMLSVLTLITLENELDQDQLDMFEGINESLLRCKELVEIFLGFSRVNINSKQKISLDMAIDKSLELLRGRMVEANIKLNLDKGLQQSLFQGPVDLFNINSATGTMIFYLLFSEILTQFSHMRLVKLDQRSNIQSSIKLSKSIHEDQFEIKIERAEEVFKRLNISKLMYYLLEFEGLKLSMLNDRISIRRTK
ncbi:MAG: HAMP domain-containing histidine kinase [Halobacteriovoraceae bacterium]|nr:HAMP domain-containing histidine kinase [Halobacteriovoraceae bacterium]